MLKASEKVFIITGASAGLGRCLALDAGKRGARVVLIARRRFALQEIENKICSSGGEAHTIQVDIREAEEVRSAFRDIESLWGRIDILINNAAVVEPLAPLVSCSDAELLNSLKTNVYGVYLATKEAMKRMIKQSTGGSIINITGGTGQHPYSGWSAYCSQKAAINMFTRCVAIEVAKSPIRIMAICPGSFDSHMQRAIRAANESEFPERSKFVRLYEQRKLANPKELARIIIDISLVDWPEMSGRVEDLRCTEFRKECSKRGIIFSGDWA